MGAWLSTIPRLQGFSSCSISLATTTSTGVMRHDRTWNLEGGPLHTMNDGEPDYRNKTCPKCRHPFKFGPKACPALRPRDPGQRARGPRG